MRVYRCKLEAIVPLGGTYRLSVMMLEDHERFGGRKGEMTTTSAVKFIDFENKLAITKNNIYIWE